MDKHTRGKWLIHVTKHHKENLFKSCDMKHLAAETFREVSDNRTQSLSFGEPKYVIQIE